MRAFIDDSKILKNIDVLLLQLVEKGLVRYGELKDGTVNFRDICKMQEYLRIKDNYISWFNTRQDQERKAKNFRG